MYHPTTPLLDDPCHGCDTQPVEELCLQTSDDEARVANSLSEDMDHSVQLNQIQSSLRDLSHSVAQLPPATMVPPSQTQPSRPRPSPASSPQDPPARGSPPEPAKGPTPAFAAIVCGTSKFDEAARANLAARKKRGNKRSSDNT